MGVSGGSQRIYLDTNVFINYLFDEARVDLVEASEAVFDAVVVCRFFLVVSDVAVREIVKVTGFSREKVFELVFRPYMALGRWSLCGYLERSLRRRCFIRVCLVFICLMPFIWRWLRFMGVGWLRLTGI